LPGGEISLYHPTLQGSDESATSFVRIDSTDIHHDMYQEIKGCVDILSWNKNLIQTLFDWICGKVPRQFLERILYKHCSIGFVVRYQEYVWIPHPSGNGPDIA
jgi:hypothetical protein